MRGKKPSEHEKYVLPAGRGVFVEVTRAVCLDWHQSRRREKYQMEKKRAHGVCSLKHLVKMPCPSCWVAGAVVGGRGDWKIVQRQTGWSSIYRQRIGKREVA